MEGEEEQSPVRDASSVAFSDPSSLVTCPFSCFPSCLVARVHWAEIRSLLCDWLALGIFVTSSFSFFQRYRGYFLVLNFGFSRENYPPSLFYFLFAKVSLLCSSPPCLIMLTSRAPIGTQYQIKPTYTVQEFWLIIWHVTHFSFGFQASHHHPSNVSSHVNWLQCSKIRQNQPLSIKIVDSDHSLVIL